MCYNFLVTDFTDGRRIFLRFAAGIVLLFSILRLSIEATQLIYDHLVYLTDWENWIEVILFICSILFASGAYVQCCVCVENWQWQLGALSIFLAWLDLVLFMKKLPLFGVYVVMYIQIIYTFLRFAFLALLFIVAFGLSFYMLFVQYSLPVSYVTSYCILFIIRGKKTFAVPVPHLYVHTQKTFVITSLYNKPS